MPMFPFASFMDVKVEGWLKLMPEKREGCIMKLRYELLSYLVEGDANRIDCSKGFEASEGRYTLVEAVGAQALEKLRWGVFIYTYTFSRCYRISRNIGRFLLGLRRDGPLLLSVSRSLSINRRSFGRESTNRKRILQSPCQ